MESQSECSQDGRGCREAAKQGKRGCCDGGRGPSLHFPPHIQTSHTNTHHTLTHRPQMHKPHTRPASVSSCHSMHFACCGHRCCQKPSQFHGVGRRLQAPGRGWGSAMGPAWTPLPLRALHPHPPPRGSGQEGPSSNHLLG